MTELFAYILGGLTATFGGNMGLAIAFLSLALRLALLPASLRAARRQQVMERLAPELAALKKRHAQSPERLMQATQQLYSENGLKLFDWTSLLMLTQLPFVVGLTGAMKLLGAKAYQASPDIALTLACAAVTALTPPDLRKGVLFAVITLAVMSRMSTGVAIYSLVSGVVGLAQSRALVRAQAPR